MIFSPAFLTTRMQIMEMLKIVWNCKIVSILLKIFLTKLMNRWNFFIKLIYNLLNLLSDSESEGIEVENDVLADPDYLPEGNFKF